MQSIEQFNSQSIAQIRGRRSTYTHKYSKTGSRSDLDGIFLTLASSVHYVTQRQQHELRRISEDYGQRERRVASLAEITGGDFNMLRLAAVFFIIAVIAAIFGFGDIAEGATDIAKILFFVFLALLALTLIVNLVTGRRSDHLL